MANNLDKYICESKVNPNALDFEFKFIDTSKKRKVVKKIINEDIVTKDDLSMCSLFFNEPVVPNKIKKGNPIKKNDKDAVGSKKNKGKSKCLDMRKIFDDCSSDINFIYSITDKGHANTTDEKGFLKPASKRKIPRKNPHVNNTDSHKTKSKSSQHTDISKHTKGSSVKSTDKSNNLKDKKDLGPSHDNLKISKTRGGAKHKKDIEDKGSIETNVKEDLKADSVPAETEVFIDKTEEKKLYDKLLNVKKLHEFCEDKSSINELIGLCIRQVELRHPGSYISTLREKFEKDGIREFNVDKEISNVVRKIADIDLEQKKWVDSKKNVFKKSFKDLEPVEYPESLDLQLEIEKTEEDFRNKILKINFFKEKIKYYMKNMKGEISNLNLKVFNLKKNEDKIDPVLLLKAISKVDKR